MAPRFTSRAWVRARPDLVLGLGLGLGLGCTAHAPAPAGPVVEIARAAAGVPGVPGGANVSSAEEFRRRKHVLACAEKVRCGGIGASERSACEIEKPSRAVEEVLALAEKGRYTVDLSQAGACLAAWANVACHPDPALAPPGCLGGEADVTLRAAVPPGGRCERWDECAHGVCHARDACRWACVANGPMGGACGQTSNCEPDAWCWEGKCLPHAKLGEPCHGHALACDQGLWCEGYVPESPGVSPEQPGACARPKAEGAPCATDDRDEHCRADLFCDWGAADPTCRARLPQGADCGAIDACADGLTCAGLTLRGAHPRGRRFATAVRGTCVPWSDAGRRCDPTATFTGCPETMHCDEQTRTCRPTGRIGDPCETSGFARADDAPHRHLRCRDETYCEAATHTCARQPIAGERCTPPSRPDDEEPCWMSQCDAATSRCVPYCWR